MAKSKAKPEQAPSEKPRFRPALSQEARENQLIDLAMDLAEQHLRDGTATSQEIVHFLKLGTTRERKELELIEKQKRMMDAKTEALQSSKNIEELYTNAIKAIQGYGRSINYKDDEIDY